MSVEYVHWILPARRECRPEAADIVRLDEALRRERWVISPDHPRADDLLDESYGIESRTGGYARLFGKNPKAPRRAMRDSDKAREDVPAPLTTEWLSTRFDPHHEYPLAREIALVFPVRVPESMEDWADAELRYPFTFGAEDVTNAHDIALFLTDDFLNGGSNNIGSIEGRCACGANLEYRSDEGDTSYTVAIDDPWLTGRIARTCSSCGATFRPLASASEVIDGWVGDTRRSLPGGLASRFSLRINCDVTWPRDRGRLVLAPELVALVETTLGEPVIELGETS